ncbi:hypothetical protein QCA50_018918 [Cerrena zonata]|uniref:Uncharacterized protein n=1 Tax=Cerrena zonata TaxID=2478898 RepID=A0AAW0FG96_9APHY
MTLVGRFDGGLDLCFMPTAQSRLLLVSHAGVSLYDFRSSEQVFGPYIANLGPSASRFWEATFSPDGSLIAASSKYTIQIFETESGKPYQDPIMAPDEFHQVTFLPDGKHIAAICGSSVYTWELCHGSQVSDQERFDRANTRGHFGDITSISFSPDGTKFLSSSEDGTVHVRSSTDCIILREYWPMEYQHAVTCVAFSADNKSIYLSLDDGTIQTSMGKVLYRPKDSGEIWQISKFYVHASLLSSEEHIIFSPFKLSKEAFVIRSSGNPDQDPHKICLDGDDFVVSNNGLLASFSDGLGKVTFVNLEGDHHPRSLLATKYNDLQYLFFSQMGEVLVSLGKYPTSFPPLYGIHVWDIRTARCLRILDLVRVSGSIHYAALDANLLALRLESCIMLYDIENGALVHTFNLWAPLNSTAYIDIRGSKLVSASMNHIIMWDLSALHIVGTIPHTDAANMPLSIHSSIAPQWSIQHENHRPTGWILGSNGERLLWIPDELRRYLDPPGSTHVIAHRQIKLPDFIPDLDWLKNYEGVGRFGME